MENYVDLTADWVVDSKNNVVYKQIANIKEVLKLIITDIIL